MQTTLYDKFQKQGGSTVHSSIPDVVAAVANLPESATKAYILLFDAVHSKGAFDKEESPAWDNLDLCVCLGCFVTQQGVCFKCGKS